MDALTINEKPPTYNQNPIVNDLMSDDLEPQNRGNSMNSNIQPNFPITTVKNIKIPYCVQLIKIIYLF